MSLLVAHSPHVIALGSKLVHVSQRFQHRADMNAGMSSQSGLSQQDRRLKLLCDRQE